MSHEQPAARRRGRRRSANVAGGRRVSHEVKVSEFEELRLQLLAADQGVTVARLLRESALAGGSATMAAHHDLAAELFAIHRYLGALSNNINQMARVANATGDLHADLRATLAAVRAQLPRVTAATAALTGEPARPSPPVRVVGSP